MFGTDCIVDCYYTDTTSCSDNVEESSTTIKIENTSLEETTEASPEEQQEENLMQIRNINDGGENIGELKLNDNTPEVEHDKKGSEDNEVNRLNDNTPENEQEKKGSEDHEVNKLNDNTPEVEQEKKGYENNEVNKDIGPSMIFKLELTDNNKPVQSIDACNDNVVEVKIEPTASSEETTAQLAKRRWPVPQTAWRKPNITIGCRGQIIENRPVRRLGIPLCEAEVGCEDKSRQGMSPLTSQDDDEGPAAKKCRVAASEFLEVSEQTDANMIPPCISEDMKKYMEQTSRVSLASF